MGGRVDDGQGAELLPWIVEWRAGIFDAVEGGVGGFERCFFFVQFFGGRIALALGCRLFSSF